MNQGYLIVSVYADSVAQPIEGASVKIVGVLNEYFTNINGKIEAVTLQTVGIENSLSPGNDEPYSVYDIEVSKEGFVSKIIKNVQVFPGVTSLQDVILTSNDNDNLLVDVINLQPNVLNGDYAPKYVEDELGVNLAVLSKVVIPEYVIVHDGVPNDTRAPEYYIPFSEYIKNVACSEIYSTWNVESIKANVLAIMSYTLNRVYTEWYPSKGYSFTITSVTAYDQKYIHNRTLFDSITTIVDEMLGLYIQRDGKEEPMFAQYCDGTSLQNLGWLWQWGSQDLALDGYNYEEILKYYYGNTLSIKSTEIVEGLPTSYPGYVLKLGSCGEEVMKIQNQLNIIRGNYPGLIQITNPNGEYDENTKEAVEKFQEVFDVNISGAVDYGTWYRISYMYLAVKRMIFGVYDR